MIRATWRNGEPTLESSVRGIAIYLDTFAISKHSRGDASLRRRFIAVLHDGADLLFSLANASEISGSQGSSSQALKEFLDEVGPNWYPIEMLTEEVMRREAKGLPASECCLAQEALRAFFSNRTYGYVAGSGRVIDLSGAFFRLGAFVEWLGPERDHLLHQSRKLDEVMQDGVRKLRAKHKKNRSWLDDVLPQPQFDPSRAATFAHFSFMRELIKDSGYQLRKGDGIDFCHAVMATAFSTFATLDKQWKRRVENLPKPNKIPRVYYEPELGALVADVETALAELRRPPSLVLTDTCIR